MYGEKNRTRRKLKYLWKKEKRTRKLKYVGKKKNKKEAKICMEKKKNKKEAKICMEKKEEQQAQSEVKTPSLHLSGATVLASSTSAGPNNSRQPSTASSRARPSAISGPLCNAHTNKVHTRTTHTHTHTHSHTHTHTRTHAHTHT